MTVPDSQPTRVRGWPVWLSATLLAAGTIAAYSQTFSVPLLHDDLPSILDDPSIRHLGTALGRAGNSTAIGRPVLSLSLAINYALSGTAVGSYHVFNLTIHILAGLTLLGIVRRTLGPRVGAAAGGLAFSIALLWLLHPLVTASVTYIIQRAESLMGLFYLLTLYCFIRGANPEGRRQNGWFVLCVIACALGMGTKEVMVSAPLIVLLYDRTFVAGNFRNAIRRRWRLYAALAATWLILPFLIISAHDRNGTVGFGTGVVWWRYALTQLPAITRYLRLCFWPAPLIFDYGMALAAPSLKILPYALIVFGLLAATLWALVKRPAAGFLGAAFFAILAPSSSILPIASETMAERRMYLPLIPVVALVVLEMHRRLGRATLPLALVLAAGLGLATVQRNRDYRSEQAIWSDTVSKCPENERARNNLGTVLVKLPGRLDEAIAQYEAALRLKPEYAEAHFNLGNALAKVPGRSNEAIAQYEEALRLKPDYPEARLNLGNALAYGSGRLDEAIAQYTEALRLKPDYAEAHFSLAVALLNSNGRRDEAVAHLEAGLRIHPNDAQARRILDSIQASKP